MAIFGNLRLEKVCQFSDKTRLDATSSFVSKDEAAITLVEIEPKSGAGFIDVTGTSSSDWYLDWEFSGVASVTETVSVRITTDGSPSTFTADIDITTEADDKLFSTDQDIIDKKSDVLKWVPDGRNSFLNVHREAQEDIIDWLDEQGYRDKDGNRLTKASLVDKEEVRSWSAWKCLELIFDDLSNAVDDVFDRDARRFESKAFQARDRSVLRYDWDNDGTVELGEQVIIGSVPSQRI